ncbi:MAG: PepSY domain-containing protein [Acidobacteriota bacterium]
MNRLAVATGVLATALSLGSVTLLAAEQKAETKKVVVHETKATEKQEEKKETVQQPSNDQAAMQREAKITMARARAIAVAKAPGTVQSGELEREHGKLIYSFDIRTSSKITTEVNVNALDGSIVGMQKENAAKEAAEKKQEAKEKSVRTNPGTQKH